MTIIGLCGTNGSGKDVVGQILVEDFGFAFVNVSDFLREEAKNRNLEPTRENLRTISAQWRREMGMGVLVDMAVDKLKLTNPNANGFVISAMRNSGEAGRIKELGGKLVWVDAQPRLRFDRVTARARDTESLKSYEQFMAEEQAEMGNAGDDAALDMAQVKSMADIQIDNNGSREQLKNTVAQKLYLKQSPFD